MKGLNAIISKLIRTFGQQVIHRPVIRQINQETGEITETFGEDKLIKVQISQLRESEYNYLDIGNVPVGDYLVTASGDYLLNNGDYLKVGESWLKVVTKSIRSIKGVERYNEYLCRAVVLRE